MFLKWRNCQECVVKWYSLKKYYLFIFSIYLNNMVIAFHSHKPETEFFLSASALQAKLPT